MCENFGLGVPLYLPNMYFNVPYCSYCQLELTSTWNPYTPCIHGYVKTETYPRLE